METKDWITLGAALLSALLLIASWFVINWLNRKNEIAKVRLKFRVEMMRSFLDFISDDRKFVKVNYDGTHNIDEGFRLDLITALEQLALFGTKEEGTLSQRIYEELGKNIYHGNTVFELRNSVVKRLKRELNIAD